MSFLLDRELLIYSISLSATSGADSRWYDAPPVREGMRPVLRRTLVLRPVARRAHDQSSSRSRKPRRDVPCRRLEGNRLSRLGQTGPSLGLPVLLRGRLTRVCGGNAVPACPGIMPMGLPPPRVRGNQGFAFALGNGTQSVPARGGHLVNDDGRALLVGSTPARAGEPAWCGRTLPAWEGLCPRVPGLHPVWLCCNVPWDVP